MAEDERTASGDAAERRAGGLLPARRRRGSHGARRRVVTAVVWALAGVLLLSGAGIGYLYYELNGNIAGIDIQARLGTDRPAAAPGESMNILVMGSDSRAGANAEYGTDHGTARSDTAMLVHINHEHDAATVVSIPRDTLIRRPSCEKKDGTVVPAARRTMFNKAYQLGGPVCAIKTVEAMTGIRMDHYIEVDFSGFVELVNTIGGVPITLREPLKDPDSHLNLPAGTHTLSGEQALALVRTRHAVGNGSDLSRIQLQQAFLRALSQRVDSIGLLSDPTRLYELVDTSTSALTTDSDLDSVADLMGLARLLRGIEAGDIRMITMPVEYAPSDRNRVLPLERKAERVWRALRHDRPPPRSASQGTAGARSDADVVVPE